MSTQSPDPMQSARSTVISIRLTGESGHCQRRRTSTNAAIAASTRSGSSAGRAARAALSASPLRLPAGGHGELLGREDVVGRVEAVGVGRQALVAGADAELVGGQHVVRLLDARADRVARNLGSLIVPIVTTSMDEGTQVQLEAAAFRRLVEHLRERTDVQNIDLMELAGFCRNCLSRWYREAAEDRGVELTDPQAREIVYGMPYEEWKSRHQT